MPSGPIYKEALVGGYGGITVSPCTRKSIYLRRLAVVIIEEAMPAALLTDVLAQELMCFRIEDANMQMIPLHLDESADPSWRYAVESGFHFDATVEVNHPYPVLVITKRFNRQWQQ